MHFHLWTSHWGNISMKKITSNMRILHEKYILRKKVLRNKFWEIHFHLWNSHWGIISMKNITSNMRILQENIIWQILAMLRLNYAWAWVGLKWGAHKSVKIATKPHICIITIASVHLYWILRRWFHSQIWGGNNSKWQLIPNLYGTGFLQVLLSCTNRYPF